MPATVLGPFPISNIAGSHVEGPVAVPANVSQCEFACDRRTGNPTIEAQPGLVVKGEMEYSFDGGVTFPRANGTANGGSFTVPGGAGPAGPDGQSSSFTTHVPVESDVVQGGSKTKHPTHARMNLSVSGGTLNTALTVTLS